MVGGYLVFSAFPYLLLFFHALSFYDVYVAFVCCPAPNLLIRATDFPHKVVSCISLICAIRVLCGVVQCGVTQFFTESSPALNLEKSTFVHFLISYPVLCLDGYFAVLCVQCQCVQFIHLVIQSPPSPAPEASVTLPLRDQRGS